MWIADGWNDYEVIDCSEGEKLERWGDYLLVRPDPQVIWNTPKTHRGWKKMNGHYHRSSKGGGEWEFFDLPEQWSIHYKELTFNLKPFSFKHTGLFPEQAANWDWFGDRIRNAGRPIKVLNLFAYTGGATLAAAAAGASVTHVDASKGMVAWAKENSRSSGLENAPIRWIVDDVYGWNFYDNNAQVFTGADENHGTHSAGTIAAARNGVGTVGICDPAYVKIMVIKTLGTSSGVGTVSNVVKAIRYAQANGASICNLSFGTMKYSEELYQAIKDSGMLFIVAAGNGDASGNGYSIDEQPMYPASFELDNIISVANLRFDGQLDRASNYGVRSVDLAAPGNYILSTITDNDYAYMSGTSMAAPMVTGTAAMLYSCDASLSLMDVRNRILQSARPIESLSGKVATGGMLDAGAAMP